MASDRGSPFDRDEYFAALSAAAQRIIPDRKKMSLEDAEAIVRLELARRAQPMSADTVTMHARTLHRGPYWELLHPWQAYREGVRLGGRWASRMDEVPVAVEDLANREAWRHTGAGVGPLAAGLQPALCQRVSKHEFHCVVEVRDEHANPVCRVEIRVSCRGACASPSVIEAVVRRV